MSRLQRALTALEGLSIGDAFGERFFVSPATVEQLIAARAMPREPWPYTDDTVMAAAIVEVLAQHDRLDQDALMAAFVLRWAEEPGRGYGGGAHHLLHRCALGEPWREVAPSLEMFVFVLSHMPKGETAAGIEQARGLGLSASVEAAAARLGTGGRVIS